MQASPENISDKLMQLILLNKIIFDLVELTLARRFNLAFSFTFVAIDAKYRKRLGVGGVVISKNLVSNIFNEFG